MHRHSSHNSGTSSKTDSLWSTPTFIQTFRIWWVTSTKSRGRILQGSYKGAKRQFAQAMSQTSARLPELQAMTQVTPNLNIKVENFGAIIAKFTKTMAEILSQNRGRGNTNYSNRQVICNFCGGENYIHDCKVVDEYVQAGKCRCNIDGKVVLWAGA